MRNIIEYVSDRRLSGIKSFSSIDPPIIPQVFNIRINSTNNPRFSGADLFEPDRSVFMVSLERALLAAAYYQKR